MTGTGIRLLPRIGIYFGSKHCETAMANKTSTYDSLSREELIERLEGQSRGPVHEHSLAAMMTASPREARRIARRQVHPAVWFIIGGFWVVALSVFFWIISL